MKAMVFYPLLLMFWTLSPANSFDPFTAAFLAGAGATLGPLAWVTWGHFHERCDSTWIHFNEPGENVWGFFWGGGTFATRAIRVQNQKRK